jgi:hypothetical protein
MAKDTPEGETGAGAEENEGETEVTEVQKWAGMNGRCVEREDLWYPEAYGECNDAGVWKEEVMVNKDRCITITRLPAFRIMFAEFTFLALMADILSAMKHVTKYRIQIQWRRNALGLHQTGRLHVSLSQKKTPADHVREERVLDGRRCVLGDEDDH